MKKIGIFIGFLLLFSAPVSGAVTVCLDNITLQKEMNYTFATDTGAKNLTITKNIDCQYGCDNVTNVCSPDPVTLNIYFAGGMFALLLIIGAIVRQWRGY